MFENLRDMWRDAGSGARLGLATGVLLILAIVVYFGSTVLRPEYQTLFSDLDPADAGNLVAELDKLKVPYRLAADGTTIQVDKSQVHALRLKLLSKSGGSLRGGVGFEIFNNTDFGMTEFAQKINYQRALQGELTRTISALDEVKSARVHLVLPESGLFKKSTLKPKASITLAMKEGRTLAPEQVLGIQRLVAAALPEIEPSAVMIADQRGITLTRAAGMDGEDGLSGRLSVKSDVEAYFTKKLVGLFDKTFGPGRVIVSVDVSINLDQVKVTREDVLPVATRGGEAVGAVTRARSTSSGDRAPGATAIAAGGAVESSKNNSSSSEVEYANGRRVEQVVSMPGSIKRLSVGVVLPNVTDKARIEEIRELSATTVGANPTRGDEIAISSFDPASIRPRVAEDVTKAVPESAGPEREAAGALVVRPEATSTALPRPEWLFAIAVILVLLAIIVLAGRRRAGPQPLTPEDRDEVLAKVRTWLARDGVLPEDRRRL